MCSTLLVILTAVSAAQAYYAATNVTSNNYGFEATLVIRNSIYPEFGADISPLKLVVEYESEKHLRVRILDLNNRRWEVPSVLQPSRLKYVKASAAEYRFDYTADPFDFRVVRLSDNEAIFDTSIFERLIFKDQYLEISTRLPNNPNIYGLGERIHDLRLDPSNRVYTIFAADIGTPVDANIYGSHPFYMELRSGRRAHGVLLLNSNGMDVELKPNSLTYKVIGGILDLFFFVGPTPAEVVQQYTSVIGRPYFPPYWTLGYHQCKWGYNTLEEVKEVVRQYRANNIPLDTMWTDIDYMDRYLDFTFDPVRFPRDQVVAFADELAANGQKYVLIIDPAIYDLDTSYTTYTTGLEDNVYIMSADGSKPYQGVVWPGSTVFPDFLHPNTTAWWTREIAAWMNGFNLAGLWIDMNEPANFVFGDDLKDIDTKKSSSKDGANYANPPYAINNHNIKAALRRKTIEMDSLHYGSIPEYNAHNLYGHLESIATRQAIDSILKKRSLVLSRSSFPGTGVYAGHWLGDNTASWSDLFYSIPGMLTFNIFGIPLVGADICGFFADTTEELCARWTSLGAFYPFARNHNHLGQIPQESYRFPLVAEAARRSLSIRYRILPYYYTLFFQAHTEGTTVVRPLFFEFDSEQDADFYYFDRQFLIGAAILISPVLNQGETTLRAYFPSVTRWFDFNSGSEQTLGWQTLSVPVTDILVHVRGGHVIPTQQAALTTVEGRKTPYTIIFALDRAYQSKGSLFIDDGETDRSYETGQYTLINYSSLSTGNSIGLAQATIANAGYSPEAKLGAIQIWGIQQSSLNIVRFNGVSVSFSLLSGVLKVNDLSNPMTSAWILEWQ